MGYKVPLFDLNIDHDELQAIADVLNSRWVSMGPAVGEFEKKFADNLCVKHVVAVSSCTAALHIALRVLGIREGDEVIVPSLTFVATVNAVMYVGAAPIFADIKGTDNLGIDVNDIRRNISSKTKAIIVMHYAGFACDMDAIKNLALDKGIYIIEDSAHSPFSQFKKMRLGTIGDIGCFSFFSNKNITCAEGGALVTNNSTYAEKAKLIRSHGMTTLSFERAKGHASSYDVVELGYNYRLDDIRGAMLVAQLQKLEKDCERRNLLRKMYIERLHNEISLILPYENYEYNSSNYIFPIILKSEKKNNRDKMRIVLKKCGIETSVHYPPVHEFEIYKKFWKKLDNTEYISKNEITLPLYFNLTEDKIEYVCSCLKQNLI
jgi:dTDP-4-amino-4,6-dideoxygalactose transaminase